MRVYTKEARGSIVKNIYVVEGRALTYNRETKTMDERLETVTCLVKPEESTIAKMVKATDFAIEKVKVHTYAMPVDQFMHDAKLLAVDGELTEVE